MGRFTAAAAAAALLLSSVARAEDDGPDEPLPEQPPAPQGADVPALDETPESEPADEPDPAPARPRVVWQSAPPSTSDPFLPAPPEPARAEEPRRASRWYGGEILLVDALSVTVFAVGAKGESAGLMVAGVGGYLLGGPIVHWNHLHAGTGFASLGLRLTLPPAGALVGVGVSNCQGEFCALGPAFIGLLVGFAGAIIVDVAALAHEEVPPAGQALRIAPSLYASKDGTRIGLSGWF